MVLKYLGALVNRAAKGSVLLTDRLTILLVPFSTFALWGLGVEMTESLQETFWLGVAITVTAVVTLRFAFAGYVLWKEDQTEKAAIKARLEHELTRPDRMQREAAHQYVIKMRNELGKALAKSVTYAELCAKHVRGSEAFYEPYLADYVENFGKVRDLLNGLAYDVPLRVICHELHSLCAKFVADGVKTSEEDFQKLQSMKKIAFRVVYKMEPNDTAEVLALAEAENVMGKMQFPDGEFADLQRLLRDEPDLAGKLRREIETGRANGASALQ